MLELPLIFGPIILIVGGAASIALGFGLLANNVTRTKFEANEKLLAGWRPLAAANDLTFKPGRYRLGAAQSTCVSGVYRGHHLKLDIFRHIGDDQKVQLYTRLVLRIDWRLIDAVEPPNLPDQVGVKEIVGQLTAGNLRSARWPIHTRFKGRELYYEQLGIETNTDYLQSLFDVLCNQAEAHLKILALGSEALPLLQKIIDITDDPLLRDTADQLLRGVTQETQTQFEHRAARILCARCLARYAPHTLPLSLVSRLTYYGCRVCRQSRDYLEAPQLTAILDNQMSAESINQAGVLQINWLVRRTLFDFDAVVIVRATDEEVERFAVQVGNDMDEARRSRYPQIRCVVGEETDLSSNTLRILDRTFGRVEMGRLEIGDWRWGD